MLASACSQISSSRPPKIIFYWEFEGWVYLALFRIRNNRSGLLGTVSLIGSLVG